MKDSTRVTVSKEGAAILFILLVVVVGGLVFFENVRASQPFKSCLQVYEATGRFAIPRGDHLYNPALDRDGNGIACEEKP